MEIGKLIKEYRIKNNMTQTQFGKIIGVNKQAVSKWENGTTTPEIHNLYSIAKEIGIEPSTIIKDFTENMPNSQFIHTHKNTYNIGLNSMFNYVNDYNSFYHFVDAIETLHSIIDTTSKLMGFVLINNSYKNTDDAKIIELIKCENDTILLEFLDYSIIFSKNNVKKIERVDSYNNEAYAFNIYMKDLNNFYFQLILLSKSVY